MVEGVREWIGVKIDCILGLLGGLVIEGVRVVLCEDRLYVGFAWWLGGGGSERVVLCEDGLCWVCLVVERGKR